MEKRKILVMDDEELVRNVAGKMLEFLGYEIALAKNGEEALALYKEGLANQKRFDAVLLDWQVPDGLDGIKTLAELLKIDPKAKGILSSGFGEEEQAGQKIASGFAAVIGKPYEMKTLRSVLAKALGDAVA